MKDAMIRRMPLWLMKPFAKSYIAGSSIEAAIQTVEKLRSQNLYSTIDLLGEEITDQHQIDTVVATYQTIVNALSGFNNASLSVKPTAFGIDLSWDVCLMNLQKVLAPAKKTGIKVTLDMEDSRYTQSTIDLFKALHPNYPNLGLVLQTRLFRTAADIEELSMMKSRIRLVIGIYPENNEIAFNNTQQMKHKLLEYIAILLDRGCYVEIATHDETVVKEALQLIVEKKGSPSQFEFQMLLGVPRARLQQELITAGYTVRLYVPFALKWADAANYLKRRLIGNPSLLSYFFKNLLHRV